MLYIMILVNIICLAYFAYKDHKYKKLNSDHLFFFVLINAFYSLIISDFPMLIFVLTVLSIFELFNLTKFLEKSTKIGAGDFYLVLALLPTCGFFIFFVLIISLFLLVPYVIVDIYFRHKTIELKSFLKYKPAYAPVLLGGYILTWLLS